MIKITIISINNNKKITIYPPYSPAISKNMINKQKLPVGIA
jgi:hypothetical protein